MKYVLILTALSGFTFSALSQADSVTTIMTASHPAGSSAIDLRAGFEDSSFAYGDQAAADKTAYCYLGDAQGVCPILQKYANAVQAEYVGGGHESMVIERCAVTTVAGARVVEARYNLSDDYRGDFDVVRKIASCSR